MPMNARKSIKSGWTALFILVLLLPVLAILDAVSGGSADQPAIRLHADSMDGLTVRLSAGRQHSAMIDYDGNCYLWGDNSFGQLGLDGSDYIDEPVRLILAEPVVDVSLGSDHTVILTSSGTVYTMGRNTFGQLGDGTTLASGKPVRISGLPPVKAVAAGGWHTLVLGEDGSVWGWGDNSSYQLGSGQDEVIENHDGEVIGRRILRPARIIGLNAAAIAAGGKFSLYIRQDGRLFAWGDNSFGQLGDGTVQTRSDPTAVIGLTSVVTISAGYQHVLAMTDDGQTRHLYAWGDNAAGQLGSMPELAGDARQTMPEPVNFAQTMIDAASVTLFSAGYTHSAAVADLPSGESGEAVRQQYLTWGGNAFGQLGLNHVKAMAVPVPLGSSLHGYDGNDYLPFDALAAGGFHQLLLSSRGLLAATGRGDRGQLGTRSIVNRQQFTAVAIPDGIVPGWPETARASATRDSDGHLTIRWPAAQDNLALAGYRLRIFWPDESVEDIDVGLQQVWTIGADTTDMAILCAIYAYDQQTADGSGQMMSVLSCFIAPEQDPSALPSDYFPDPIQSDWLAGNSRHRWRPGPDGLVQPLEVPWDTADLASGAVQEPPAPPRYELLLLTSGFAMLLTLLAVCQATFRQIKNALVRRSHSRHMIRPPRVDRIGHHQR